ncbi:MAG: AAA family ATPase [Palaeococcus sp.]|uniref:MinD/ParA family ATP-binding protein n=1 Tax=Palaeococcus sp. (in: euryarchaeotes) TaxID=2820298 RepID=UPI0025FD0F8D|nr:AAA family ATPase [Palaeococcus sp. (in: euryarchaeotes)]MCD6559833.1 AAA family ATPase [Palaeococcus sp. (in: euryarchaeotes)]
MSVILITGLGGSGKTIITLNLATYLAKREYNVLVVDGDLFLPNIAEYLELGNLKYTIHSLLSDPSLDVGSAIYKHQKTDLSIMPGDKRLSSLTNVYLPLLVRIIEEASKGYALTFVDTPSNIPLEELELFNLATHQIVILDVERIPRNTLFMFLENEIEKYLALDINNTMAHGIILNKADILNQENLAKYIEDTFEIPVLGVIPYDNVFLESTFMRNPVLLEFPHSDAGIALKDCGKIVEKWLFELTL